MLLKKKHPPSSAARLAASSHSFSMTSPFCRCNCCICCSKHCSNFFDQLSGKWKASTTPCRRSSISCRAFTPASGKDVEGRGPATFAATRPYSSQSLPTSASSKASFASVPVKLCVCTTSTNNWSRFATLAACSGTARLALLSTFCRRFCVASTYSGSSSESGFSGRLRHSRVSWDAIGTSKTECRKSRATRCRISSKRTFRNPSSCTWLAPVPKRNGCCNTQMME
mmetsp:Transcript_49256/g.130465  ORF Transcript_49256/g.130465 Transcript_49256/m.130465 type:complete len:226 (+) Transcript_49256:1202-1879(+)